MDKRQKNKEEKDEISVNSENVEEIIKLMEIHTTYIQGLSSPILWIRNIYVIGLLAIISKVYLNQIDFFAPNIVWYHGVLGAVFLAVLCYFNEGIFQLWQASHLNRMSKFDKGLRKHLFNEKSEVIPDIYSEKETADEIKEKYKSGDYYNAFTGIIKFYLCKMPTTLLFYLISLIFAIGMIWYITHFLDC